MNPFDKLTKKELMKLASEAGIRGRSRMTRDELAEALASLSLDSGELPDVGAPSSISIPLQDVHPQSRKKLIDIVLPEYLGENRLCLLPQSPKLAFAYWEVGEDLIDRALLTLRSGMGRLLLRVMEGNVQGAVLLVHEVYNRRGSWYLDIERSGIQIQAELGLEGDRGSHFSLLTSNRITLPRDAPSEEEGSLWMTRGRDREEIFYLPVEPRIMGLFGISKGIDTIGYRHFGSGSGAQGVKKR